MPNALRNPTPATPIARLARNAMAEESPDMLVQFGVVEQQFHADPRARAITAAVLLAGNAALWVAIFARFGG